MMRSTAYISAVALGLAALFPIACPANAQSNGDMQSTTVRPTAEAAPGSQAPAGGTTSSSTIRWNQPPVQTPSSTVPSPAAPGNVTPSAPPPGATKLPPGTVVPPPDSADSGTIRWNAPQSSVPSTVPGAPVGPAVSWRSQFRGGVIWIEIIDPASFYRVERIDLVAPDGRSFTANEITRTQARYDYTADTGSNVGVGAWGGSHHSGVGVGIGFPLGGRGTERADDATHSVARFQLADPAAYRRTVANWSVHARLVDSNGHPSVALFPAPKPSRY
jgi:hypothetical protein